ncbi:VWA domain-containing protein [Marinobacterium sp. YM272]|uniref:VWA domain-containing protein n=1 Tax=Marinobacterium sp. YM272 TaxID=3421654 RepID=UPI003D7F7BE4
MGKSLKTVSDSREIDTFLNQARELATTSAGAARLMFAMDATASRSPTWDHACQLHNEMFLATGDSGKLQIQLCYYRGYREFHYSRWVNQPEALLQEMNAVTCLGGHTQIGRVLEHALREHQNHSLNVVVLVGDCCEEPLDPLCELAGQLGLLGIPLFCFHEGDDAHGRLLFEQLARLSGGAFARFDLHSADRLKQLLSAAAVYATGGIKALEEFAGKNRDILALTHQLNR